MLLFLKIGYPKLDAVSTKSIKVAITRAEVEKSPPSSEPNMTHESPGLKLAMAQAGLRRGPVDASICQTMVLNSFQVNYVVDMIDHMPMS